MSIASILLTIGHNLVRAWAWLRNMSDRYHFLFRGLFFWTALRVAVAIATAILSRLYTAFGLARSAVSAVSRTGSVGAMQYLSLANAIFPLQEAFALALALLVVKIAFLGLNGVRYAYKNIPFKAS